MDTITQTRRENVRSHLAEAGVDLLLVSHLPNVRYLTGFAGTAGRLLVGARPGADLFVTDGRYAEQADVQVPDVERLFTRGDAWLPDRVRGRLGVESQHESWDRVRALVDLLPDVEVVPAPGHVETLRETKDDTELAAITRACTVADAAFADLLEWLRPGLTEREVARRLEVYLTDHGADDRAFPPIVAAGAHSARPHHRPTTARLEEGDVVKCDFGALVDGYHSDMTRMVAIGQPPGELADVFSVVRAAQEAGLDAVVAGAGCAAVDAACRGVIADAGYADQFVHSTGHGIGVDLHEAPSLRAGADATLRARMTVTVEPGIYLPGVGGVRIEDTVAVTEGPPDVLTTTGKDLVVLG